MRSRRLRVDRLADCLLRAQRARLQGSRARLERIRERHRRFEPAGRLLAARSARDLLSRRFAECAGAAIAQRRHRLAMAGARLKALAPEAVLARGYCIARASDDSIVRSAADVALHARLHLVLHRGALECLVEGRTLPGEEGA